MSAKELGFYSIDDYLKFANSRDDATKAKIIKKYGCIDNYATVKVARDIAKAEQVLAKIAKLDNESVN